VAGKMDRYSMGRKKVLTMSYDGGTNISFGHA
jgi:hypothetical protein